MSSERFAALVQRVAELRQLLLPLDFDPTGSYLDAPRITTCALSFRVLVHAEVETYLEDRVIEIAKTAQKSWEDSRFVSRVTLHLLGFSGRSMSKPPAEIAIPEQVKRKSWEEKVLIDDRLVGSTSDFVRYVMKENHGLKEKNISSMLIPIGFDIGKCDDLFLDTMNNFGEARGVVAHSSGASFVSKAVDPKDEYEAIARIILALKIVDDEFDGLLTAAAPSPVPAG